jgi:hypothetical protein
MLEFGPMDDPLRIPDEKKRSGGLTGLFERPDRGWSYWIFLAVIVVLNCWFDYYHPLGFLIGIIIAFIFVIRPLRNNRP